MHVYPGKAVSMKPSIPTPLRRERPNKYKLRMRTGRKSRRLTTKTPDP